MSRVVSREPWWWLALAAALLLMLRYFASNLGLMVEGDEITIAAGLAAIQRDMPADLYRYGVQFGYYHLVSALATLVGGPIYRIPDLMVLLSVVAGTVLPLAGLMAFRDTLTRGERWLLFALLVANPVIWQSAQYGNTAMPSVALTAVAACLLSNRPGRGGELVAMACFGAAILIRADAVLVTSGIFALLWWHHRRFWRAAAPVALTGLVVGLVFLVALRLDPRMGSMVEQVAAHTREPFLTHFVEFLVFAVSPIPLLLAAAGARDLQRERPVLLAVLAAWVIPLSLFYFPATTTPRYLLHIMLPISVASAVGIWGSLPRTGRFRTLGGIAILGAAFLHLFVGLSAFTAARTRSWLADATLPSHDGPVYTGALLYKSFRWRPARPGPTGAPFRYVPFSESEKSLTGLLDTLRSGAHRGERVVLVVSPGYSERAHFLVQAGGANVVRFDPGWPFLRMTHFEIGGAELAMVNIVQLTRGQGQLPVTAGDEVLGLFQRREEADSAFNQVRLSGLAWESLGLRPPSTRLWRFRSVVAP